MTIARRLAAAEANARVRAVRKPIDMSGLSQSQLELIARLPENGREFDASDFTEAEYAELIRALEQCGAISDAEAGNGIPE